MSAVQVPLATTYSPLAQRIFTMQRALVLCLVLLMICATPSAVPAEDKMVEPQQTWKGSVEDRELLGKPPTVIATAAAWKAQWEAWKLADELPKVDFSKQLVVVQTTVGSQIRPILKLDDQGDLKVLGLATKDLRPGFRYVLVTVARDGVKSVNGLELPSDETAKGKAAVTGNIIGPEGVLEPGLVVKVQLLDVSLQDVAAKVLGEQTLRDPKQFPIPFAVAYDPTKVSTTGLMYAIGVRIEQDGKLRYINDTRISVISNGSPTTDVKAPVIKIK